MKDNSDLSFAELFRQSGNESSRLEPGQKIKATIVSIAGENIFLDIGGKSEGYLLRSELLDENGSLTVKTGDKIEAYFLSAADNELLFTTKIGAGSIAKNHLEEAYRSEIPVEGIVEKEIKGGFEIKVASCRAFCPYSQMDIQRINDPAKYIGQSMSFIIIEFSAKGRNIVLSRRKILEEDARQKKAALQETLQEGNTVRGRISSIRDFGAFVNIDNGIEGLIPISEIGWGRVDDLHEVLSVDQEVDVVITKLDWENDRYSFSLKEALPDPWDEINRFPEGSCHQGQVARLLNFGAFVTLHPGLDGLIHISKLGSGRRLNHSREELEEGQKIDVRIEKVDHDNRRISLNLLSDDSAETEELQNYSASQKTAKPIGLLGDLLAAKLAEKNKRKM